MIIDPINDRPRVYQFASGSDFSTVPCMKSERTRGHVPLWLKWTYTAFLAVLVPVYWANYGPTNFLYFCDVALLLGLLAVWTEKPIFASMAAVGILVPQLLWCLDFVTELFGLNL